MLLLLLLRLFSSIFFNSLENTCTFTIPFVPCVCVYLYALPPPFSHTKKPPCKKTPLTETCSLPPLKKKTSNKIKEVQFKNPGGCYLDTSITFSAPLYRTRFACMDVCMYVMHCTLTARGHLLPSPNTPSQAEQSANQSINHNQPANPPQ